MSNPRVEEVSDSDPEIEDPSDFLPNEVMRRADAPAPSQSSQRATTNPTLIQPQQVPSHAEPSEADVRAKKAELKPYITIYPIYFSKARTRQGGRRVSSKLAIENPLAFNLLKATRQVVGPSLRVAFEPDKTHPKDWSNPGRVKVELFDRDTHAPLHPTIKNKKYLYNLIAKELQKTPTKADDPLQLKLQGLPVPEKFLETKVAVPRGWKMNDILPVHSAAVSGGGVNDNFFKEAMEEMKQMQAANGGQMPAGPGGMDMNAMAQMMQGMGGMGALGGGGNTAGGSKKKEKKKG